MLGLGEFEDIQERLTKDHMSLKFVWLYFILATILTNIIMLNVLIAIVNDVYAKIIESRDRYSLQ